MNGESKKLTNLIGAHNFLIPIYQRPYSWREEQCEQLMADIEACALGKRSSHFFGSVVRVPDANASVIIDGQQRITTISLLLLAILRALDSGKKTTTNSLVNTRNWVNKFLFDEYALEPRTLKLKHMHGDEVSFGAVVANKESENDRSRICENFRFFCKALEESDLTIDQILKGIQLLFVIDITIDKSDNPQLVFESINSTGLDLTEGDKIRNYILMGLNHDAQSKLFNEYWKPIEGMVRRDGDEDGVGLFVRDTITAITGEVPNLKRIYTGFKRFCADQSSDFKNPEDLAKTLFMYAEVYHLLLHPEDIKDNDTAYLMSNINRQECLPAYPFLLKVFLKRKKDELTDSQVATILRIVDAYVFRRLMCDLPTNSLNKVFTELNRQIEKTLSESSGKITYEDALAYVLRSRTGKAKFPDNDEFRNGMMTKPVYEMRTKNRAYLFSRLENGISKAAVVHVTTDVVFEKVCSKEYTVEHVMPQTLTDDWKRKLGPSHADVWAKWVHTLGNLTLTAYNTELGNKSFATKSGRTFDELKADQFGFASEANHLYLNKFIAEQTQWTSREMEARARNLADRALKIWEYPVTTYTPPKIELYKYSLLDHPSTFFTGSKPLAFIYNNIEYEVDSWYNLALRVCLVVYEQHQRAFIDFAASNKSPRVACTESKNMTKVGEGVYVRCEGSAWDKCQTVRHVLQHCQAGDVQICFREEIEEDD